jgi:hypothetical protein
MSYCIIFDTLMKKKIEKYCLVFCYTMKNKLENNLLIFWFFFQVYLTYIEY